MSGAELALAIVGVLHVCYQTGKELISTCRAFHNADVRLAESVVRVEACWVRVETQLHTVEKMAPLMNERHRDIHEHALQIFRSKLELTTSKLSRLKRTESPHWVLKQIEAHRFRFAVVRRGLEEAVRELRQWREETLDPSWFLMMKIADPQVDYELGLMASQKTTLAHRDASAVISDARHLRRALTSTDENPKASVMLPADGLVPRSSRAIPFSPVSTARRADTGQTVLLDPVTCAFRPSGKAVLQDIRNFATKLRHANPFTFGLLECKGIVENEKRNAGDDPAFLFVFRLPETHSRAESLRSRLLRGPGEETDSLSGRVALARQLVQAVNYVHIYDFVHKNISPENILILSGADDDAANTGNGGELTPREISVLVGFDVLRDADGHTRRLGDEDSCKNLYRHPSRQGRAPEVDYEMRHDIYSVGVCLLKIGLWASFIDCPPGGSNTLASLLGYDDAAPDEIPMYLGNAKERFVGVARDELRRRMGTKYSEVVETCLTCLDDGNEDFGDEAEFQDQGSVAVGARYIEKVVAKLGEIVV